MTSSLKDTLEEYRALSGLSQAELARQSGVSRRTIINAERGHHPPSYETIARISDALCLTDEQRAGLLAMRNRNRERT